MTNANAEKAYPKSVTIKTGSWYYDAWAEICPACDECAAVEWYSDNPSVATVNASNGYIYARSPGTAKIYVCVADGGDADNYLLVTVSDTIYVSATELSRASASVEKGDSITLAATLYPAGATNKTISWRSTNTNVADVDNGVVTAKTKGSAYIYAEAADGSGEYAKCYVRVTEDILVTSVTVNPASKTMNMGDTTYLYATVCPADATDKCVEWTSSDPCVVMVNPDSGLVVARGAGEATITATARDGSGQYAECVITVNARVPVTGIVVCPESLMMYIGDVEYLNTAILPSNATNQSVTWHSSDENVVTVGLYTGRVSANTAGSATITATTVDGSYAASCVVTVKIENVTIKKDGYFNEVIFESSGKTWKCINNDTIYDEEGMLSPVFNQRAYQNFYTLYDVNEGAVRDHTPKEYSDDEIKLLYAIDPYGVADYVKRYAESLPGGLESTLQHKDRMFELLFKREPKYFARTISGTWYETTDTENKSAVVSESEEIFGMHIIYDALTIINICSFVIDVIGLALGTSFFKSGTIRQAIKKIATTVLGVLSVGEAVVRNELASYAVNSNIETAFEETELNWAYNYISLYDDINAIAEVIVATPNYNGRILNYCAHDTNYVVTLELRNGTECKIEDICSAINN